MKVYIVKFALTKGIIAADAEVNEKTGTAIVKGAVPWIDHRFAKGQWSADAREAVRLAEKMRDAAVSQAERTIERLKDKTFTPPELI